MGECRCGCGNPTSGAYFLPGHDQKLRTMLVDEAGGLFALQELVLSAKKYSIGAMSAEEFLDIVRRIFPEKNQSGLG